MSGDEATRTDLSDLVRVRMDEKGKSVRALADACIDPENPDEGPLWKRGTVENLIKGRSVKAPREPELRALAAGLDLPVRAVQEAAAAQYLGLVDYVWNADRTTRVLVARIKDMSSDEREQLAAIAETFHQRSTVSDEKAHE